MVVNFIDMECNRSSTLHLCLLCVLYRGFTGSLLSKEASALNSHIVTKESPFQMRISRFMQNTKGTEMCVLQLQEANICHPKRPQLPIHTSSSLNAGCHDIESPAVVFILATFDKYWISQ
jgi:hypothetical protein